MSHSQSRVWALSQTANKDSGTYSVCLSTRQLHLKDGTVHQHEPRGNICPGSDKLPLHVPDDRAAILASRSASCLDAASVPAPTSADSSSGCFQPSMPLPSTSGQTIRGSPSVSPTTPLPSHSVPSHPVLGAPTIKHIPKPDSVADKPLFYSHYKILELSISCLNVAPLYKDSINNIKLTTLIYVMQ